MLDVPTHIPTFDSYEDILKSGLLTPIDRIRAERYANRQCADGSEPEDPRQFTIGGYITSAFGEIGDANPTTSLTIGKRLLPQIMALEGAVMSEWKCISTEAATWELRYLWNIPPSETLLEYESVKPIASFIREIIAEVERLSGADMVHELVDRASIENSPNTGKNATIILKNGNTLRIGRYLSVNDKLLTDMTGNLLSLPNQYPQNIRKFVKENYRKTK